MNEPRPCKSCGAMMIWATSPLGRALPLDAKPLAGLDDARLRPGVVLYQYVEGKAQPVKIADAGAVISTGEPVYLSHFATCPNATAHSIKRRPGQQRG